MTDTLRGSAVAHVDRDAAYDLAQMDRVWQVDARIAAGIMRAFAVAGALGRALCDPDDVFAAGRMPDDRRWALDHVEIKLLRLPEEMLTATGRAMAAARVATMRRFLDDLAAETGVAAPCQRRAA